MRKFSIYNLVLVALVSIALSCTDDALDPLKVKEVKKGTILALRGTQLDNIYFEGIPGAEFFPRVIQGTEVFAFDAEYLSEDPESLESVDIFIIKKTRTADGITTERVQIKNVPFSEFKHSDDYTRPWVSVSLKLTDILAKIGITDYADPAVIDELLTLYQPGINIESDLNLKDGSKVSADLILASGLFDSDQFYPAQKLTYNATEFCPYDKTWEATYKTVELYASGDVSDFYNSTIAFNASGDGTDDYTVSNLANKGYDLTATFGISTTNPSQQSIDIPQQTLPDGRIVQPIGEDADGSFGSYDQCSGTLTIHVVILNPVTEKTTEYDWQFEPL